MPLRQNPATLPVLKTEDLKQTGQDIYVQCHSPCSAIQIVSALALACSHLKFHIFRSCLPSNLHEFHLTRLSVPVLGQNLDLHLHFPLQIAKNDFFAFIPSGFISENSPFLLILIL